MPEPWPNWATATDIDGGRWRLDLNGTLNGTRIAGHATAGSLDPLRKLVGAIAEFEAEHESVAALIARAGLAGDADLRVALPKLSRFVIHPLMRSGITMVSALAALSDEELLGVRNFGQRRLTALKTALREVP